MTAYEFTGELADAANQVASDIAGDAGSSVSRIEVCIPDSFEFRVKLGGQSFLVTVQEVSNTKEARIAA